MEMTFRTAAFGGFHRQDVTDYIANMAKENSDRVAALEQERDQLRQELEARGDQAEALEALQKRCQELEAEARDRAARLTELEAQAADREALSARVEELEGQAEEYSDLKQHIAGIELDAHRRADQLLEESRRKADAIVSQANADAAQVRKQAEEQLLALTQRYEELLRAFEVAAGHVKGELRKMDVAVAQLPLAFNHLSAGLRELKEKTLPGTKE